MTDGDARLDRAISAARAGSRDAVAYLWCRYAGYIHRYIRSILRDEADAQAVTESVFAEVLGTIASDDTPFEARLLELSRSTALARLHQRRARFTSGDRALEQPPPAHSPGRGDDAPWGRNL